MSIPSSRHASIAALIFAMDFLRWTICSVGPKVVGHLLQSGRGPSKLF